MKVKLVSFLMRTLSYVILQVSFLHALFLGFLNQYWNQTIFRLHRHAFMNYPSLLDYLFWFLHWPQISFKLLDLLMLKSYWLYDICFSRFIIWMSLKEQILGCPRLKVFTIFVLLVIIVLFLRSKIQKAILF